LHQADIIAAHMAAPFFYDAIGERRHETGFRRIKPGRALKCRGALLSDHPGDIVAMARRPRRSGAVSSTGCRR